MVYSRSEILYKLSAHKAALDNLTMEYDTFTGKHKDTKDPHVKAAMKNAHNRYMSTKSILENRIKLYDSLSEIPAIIESYYDEIRVEHRDVFYKMMYPLLYKKKSMIRERVASSRMYDPEEGREYSNELRQLKKEMDDIIYTYRHPVVIDIDVVEEEEEDVITPSVPLFTMVREPRSTKFILQRDKDGFDEFMSRILRFSWSFKLQLAKVWHQQPTKRTAILEKLGAKGSFLARSYMEELAKEMLGIISLEDTANTSIGNLSKYYIAMNKEVAIKRRVKYSAFKRGRI